MLDRDQASNRPDISVIVPVHNEAAHLEDCIAALTEQDYPADRYEVIFVDNGSTDGSQEVVRRHSRVQLHHEPTPGDFAARNRGAAVARGALLAFTDSDTAPRPDWVRQAIHALEDPQVAVVLGALQFAGDSRGLRLLARYEAAKNDLIFGGDAPEIYYGCTCNMIVRRSVFERLGPFHAVPRNADVVFVRRVVDALSPDAVRFSAAVAALRLEIANLRDFLAKQHLYGRDLGRYAAMANARPLNMRERLHALARAWGRDRLSLVDAMLLSGLLFAGALAYDSGRHRGPHPRPRGLPAEDESCNGAALVGQEPR